MDGGNIEKRYPVVLRFEGLHPSDLGGYEAHRMRKGGDLGHVDRERGGRNRRLIGEEDWAAQALAEIDTIRSENFAAELESLQVRNRKKDIKRRLAEGPHDPWRPTRHGPMREVILTANKEWFDEDLSEFFGEGENWRVEQFERLAVGWLKHQFGDDVIHARADLDEQAYHIHAVVMPRATVETTRTDSKSGEKKTIASRRMLQPSKFEAIRDYETAQDSVGEWFAELGLVRGERRKQAIRDALADGREPPAKKRHVRPAEWRQNEEKRLAEEAAHLEKRKRGLKEREAEADGIIGFADAVAAGTIDENGKTIADAPDRDDGGSKAAKPTAPTRIASAGFARARSAFRAVSQRLHGRASKEAEARAEKKVESAITDIKRADQIIIEIAAHLPEGLRKRVANTRRKLTATIMSLDPSSKGRGEGRKTDPDSR